MKKLVGFVLVLLLAGCFPNHQRQSVQPESVQNVEAEHTEWRTRLSDSVEVNATIDFPRSDLVKQAIAPHQIELSQLAPVVDVSQYTLEFQEQHTEQYTSYGYRNGDQVILINVNNISYYSGEQLEGKDYTLLIDTIDTAYNADFFVEHPPVALPEMSIDEAKREAEKYISALKVQYNSEPRVATLTKDKLAEYNEVLEEFKLKTDVTPFEPEEDECYVLVYDLMYHDVRLSHWDTEQSVSNYSGGKATFLVNSKGVFYMDVTDIFDFVADSIPLSHIIGVEGIKAIVEKEYVQLAEKNNIYIQAIELRYLPVMLSVDTFEFEMLPVWVIRSQVTNTESDKGVEPEVQMQIDIFSAVDGRRF